MMHEQAFTITIKPAEDSQLDLLEKEFSPDTLSKSHYKRYEVQKQGEGVYLIAWHDHIPIGHFLLRWSGPDDTRVMKYVDVTHSAFLEAGATSVAFRRKGVGLPQQESDFAYFKKTSWDHRCVFDSPASSAIPPRRKDRKPL